MMIFIINALLLKKNEAKGSEITSVQGRKFNEEEFKLLTKSQVEAYKYLEYSDVKDPKWEWVIKIARISRFFHYLY